MVHCLVCFFFYTFASLFWYTGSHSILILKFFPYLSNFFFLRLTWLRHAVRSQLNVLLLLSVIICFCSIHTPISVASKLRDQMVRLFCVRIKPHFRYTHRLLLDRSNFALFVYFTFYADSLGECGGPQPTTVSAESAPDRMTALASFAELCSIAPTRQWNLVKVCFYLLLHYQEQ